MCAADPMPDPIDDAAPRPLDIRPLAERKNLVHMEDFAEVLPPVEGFLKWFDALPDIYGSKSLKHVVSEVVTARERGKEVGEALLRGGARVGLLRRGLRDEPRE